MASILNRLNLLKKEPTHAVENILIESLRHARDDEVSPICQRLIQMGGPVGLAAAIRNFNRLEPEARQLLEAKPLKLEKVIKPLFRGGRSDGILEMIDLIESRGELVLAEELTDLLDREDSLIADRAAGAIYKMAREISQLPRKQADIEINRLDKTVARALETYRGHRQEKILYAAAFLAKTPGPALSAILDNDSHPVHFSLRGIVEHLENPMVRHNLLLWADIPALGRAVARRLHALSGIEQYTDFLIHGHLLLCRGIRMMIVNADRPGRCLPDLLTAVELPGNAQAMIPLYARALRLPAHVKDKYLGQMISLPEPRARIKALKLLTGRRSAQTQETIVQFCFDVEPSIARLAARYTLNRCDEGEVVRLELLERSPLQSISQRARNRLAGLGVDQFMKRWGALKLCDRMVAAYRLLAKQKQEFLSALGIALKSSKQEEMLLALGLIRRMQLTGSFEKLIMGLSFHNEARVASAAIIALGEAGQTKFVDTLRAALKYSDPRVQANAVEALIKLNAPETLDLVSFLAGSRANRPRANAVWAMLRSGRDEGERNLRNMLDDPDPLHRVSGLWVARRTGAVSVIETIRRMASDDQSREIRVRAHRTARGLMQHPRIKHPRNQPPRNQHPQISQSGVR